jgi:ubiquinone/menaquinone biosynthesis C-methylase UbiE
MPDLRKQLWEESYDRKENFIFFPKEEVVKFLNRFVRKRIGYNSFKDILTTTTALKALDLGCGVGRQTILMEEFGIESYGVDISSKAINEAIALAKHLGFNLKERFVLLQQPSLPFADDFFDIAISDSVLDSMEYTIAKQYMLELNRTVTSYVYLNVIAGKTLPSSEDFAGDVIVESKHEKGTVQSYYNKERIEELISGTDFKIAQLNQTTEESLLSNKRTCRYHIVLAKGRIKS